MSDIIDRILMFKDYFNEPGAIINSLFIGIIIAAIIIGIIWCFFGFKIFRIIVALSSFIIGAFAGIIGAAYIIDNIAVATAAGVVIGVIFAILAVKIYFVGLFLNGFLYGFFIIYILTEATVYAVLAGVILGVVVAAFRKSTIIFSTALIGGFLLGDSITKILTMIYSDFNVNISGGINLLIKYGFVLMFLILGYSYQKRKNPQLEDY